MRLTNTYGLDYATINEDYNSLLRQQSFNFIKDINKRFGEAVEDKENPATLRSWKHYFHQTNRFHFPYLPLNALDELENTILNRSDWKNERKRNAWTKWVWDALQEEVNRWGGADLWEKAFEWDREHGVVELQPDEHDKPQPKVKTTTLTLGDPLWRVPQENRDFFSSGLSWEEWEKLHASS